MRQRREFCWHPERTKFALYKTTPASGANQPLAKPVAQTLLITDALYRCGECPVADRWRPQGKNPGFLRVEIFSLTAGEALQNRFEPLASVLHTTLPIPVAEACWKVDALVDNVQMAIVVQHALIRRVTRKYGDPEINIRLQFLR